ncbi:hypothetical protein [Candidatus Liberibacter solanacearum]|nr:hypothetical protein [Candidatus Liberibacter solanacearum]
MIQLLIDLIKRFEGLRQQPTVVLLVFGLSVMAILEMMFLRTWP